LSCPLHIVAVLFSENLTTEIQLIENISESIEIIYKRVFQADDGFRQIKHGVIIYMLDEVIRSFSKTHVGKITGYEGIIAECYSTPYKTDYFTPFLLLLYSRVILRIGSIPISTSGKLIDEYLCLPLCIT